MAVGAAATNVGTLGGSLSGTLPNPTLAAGAVGTSQIAAGAASQTIQVIGATGSPTITSASFVDVPEMSITFTSTGGVVVAWFSTTISMGGTMGNASTFAFSIDGAAEVGQHNWMGGTTANYQDTLTMFWYFGTVAAGRTHHQGSRNDRWVRRHRPTDRPPAPPDDYGA